MYSYVKNTGQKTGNVSAPCPRLGTQAAARHWRVGTVDSPARALATGSVVFVCCSLCSGAVVGGGPPLSDIRTHVISSRQ